MGFYSMIVLHKSKISLSTVLGELLGYLAVLFIVGISWQLVFAGWSKYDNLMTILPSFFLLWYVPCFLSGIAGFIAVAVLKRLFAK